MAVRIIADSTCEISQEEAKKLNITVLPLHVMIDGVEYRDGVDISNREFFAMLRNAVKLPKTSAVAPSEFLAAYKKGPKEDEIIYIAMSSLISSCYQDAHIAKSEAIGYNIEVYDSTQATIGLYGLVMAAVVARDQGMNRDQIITHLNDIRKRIVVRAAFDDLRYLKMGGRLSGTAAKIGSAMHIKPIITMKEGKIHIHGVAIGFRRAMNRMIDELKTADVDYSLPATLAHSDAPEFFGVFKRLVKAAKPDFPYERVNFVGIAVGSHAGPGCVGLVYFRKAGTH